MALHSVGDEDTVEASIFISCAWCHRQRDGQGAAQCFKVRQLQASIKPTCSLSSTRQEAVSMFYHGYDNYMEIAFPEDEVRIAFHAVPDSSCFSMADRPKLRPISCSPLTRDQQHPERIGINDVLGNYSLTLVDTLSTLAVLASSPSDRKRSKTALEDFQLGVQLLVENYGDGSEGPAGQGARARGFRLDSKVQVFETVIRGVGGLLSAHLFAVGDLPIRIHRPQEHTPKPEARRQPSHGDPGFDWPNGFRYDGQLLRLALDLGKRLLPAFNTPTGIPYPRVNLMYGIPFYANTPANQGINDGECRAEQSGTREITETCTAGAGSLVLEFVTLSRLTGDSRFERAAKRAFWEVWSRRSSVGLVGGGVDAETGLWTSATTGVS